jgi:hypothetical protein
MMISELNLTYLGITFGIVSFINGFFAIYHIKHAKVSSRLLLAISLLFLSLACWFDAVAISLPEDQVYGATWIIYFSRVFIFINIGMFSASMIHLFKKEMNNYDTFFVAVPIVAIVIASFFTPYQLEYYSYGWGISNYTASIFITSPFVVATMLYVLQMAFSDIQKMNDKKTRNNMKIFLVGWSLSYIMWGVVICIKLMTGLPDFSTIAISIVMLFAQYPFLTKKAKE